MKKLSAVFTALILTASCFSCSDEKKPESSSEITGEPIETEIEEQLFITYSYNDFKTVNVPWNSTTDEPPVELKCYEFPDYDFGERILPFIDSDDPFQYYLTFSNKDYYENCDEDMQKRIYDNFMEDIKTAQKGTADRIQRDGNKIYLTVNYDNICLMYDWGLYCIDMDTDEVSEVYSYSGLDNHSLFWFTSAVVIDNVMYVPMEEYDENNSIINSQIIAIDLETKEESVIMESKKSISITKTPDCKLMISESYDENNNKYCIYNTKTKEISEFAPKTKYLNFYGGCGLTAYFEKPEGSRKADLVTENYRLETGISSFHILYADNSKAVVLTPDTNILHTFDFAKMEHYTTELKSKADMGAAFGDGLVLFKNNSSNTTVYYFIAELGLAFTLAEKIHLNSLFTENNNVSFAGMTDVIQKEYGIDIIVDSKYNSLYWLEEKEK